MPRVINYRGQQITFPDGTPDSAIINRLAEIDKASPAGVPEEDSAASRLKGLGRAALQGLTFGFGDELAAGARSAFGPETYQQALKSERQALDAFRRDNPVPAAGAELVGSLPLMAVPGLNASRGVGLGRSVLNAGLLGGAMGAASGFGNGTDMGDRAQRAVKGGLLGGAMGAAIPVVGAVGGKAAQMAVDTLGAAPYIGPMVRRLPGTMAPGEMRGGQRVLESLDRDGVTLNDMAARVQQAQAQAPGKPVSLADFSGENTLGMADAAMLHPSRERGVASDFLASRAAEAPTRILSDLRTGTAAPGDDAFAFLQQVAARRAQAAAPLYDAAYQAGAGPITDPDLLKALSLPHVKDAYARAQRIAQLEGRPLKMVYTQNGAIAEPPDLQTWDYIKRGLDDVLQTGRQSSLGNTEMRALRDVRGKLVGKLDSLFPEYAKARSVFAGESRLMTAAEDGAAFAHADPREVRQLLTTEYANPSERQAYLLGAIDGLKSQISSAPDGADVYKRVFGSEEKRKALRELFPSQAAFDQFQYAMSLEKAMRRTQDTVRGNSKTMARAVANEDLAGGEVAARPSMDMFVSSLINKLLKGREASANSKAIIPLLLGDNPAGSINKLRGVQDRIVRLQSRPYRSPLPTGILSGLLVE